MGAHWWLPWALAVFGPPLVAIGATDRYTPLEGSGLFLWPGPAVLGVAAAAVFGAFLRAARHRAPRAVLEGVLTLSSTW